MSILLCHLCNHVYPLTRLRERTKICGDAFEFIAWQGDGRCVLGVWNTKVFLVDVHQLDVVLADPVALGALKGEVDNIWRILGLHGQNVLALRTFQDLGEGGEIDSEGNVSIAAEGRKGLGLEHHRHERDVRVVHGLERDAGVIAVEVAVLHEIFDGIDDLRWR